MRPPAGDAKEPDGTAAAGAGLALPAVDAETVTEAARLAGVVPEITEGGTVVADGPPRFGG